MRIIRVLARLFSSIPYGAMPLMLAALVVPSVEAQIPAPQINLTGNIGCQGFPCVNNGTLIMAADANRTMTAQETSAFFIKVTSSVSMTATRNLIAPAGRFPFTIENATTGGQSIQIIGASGTGVTIANGSTVGVWNDGTNFVQVGSAGSSGVNQIIAGSNVTISPGGGTGNVTINASGGGGGAAFPSSGTPCLVEATSTTASNCATSANLATAGAVVTAPASTQSTTQLNITAANNVINAGGSLSTAITTCGSAPTTIQITQGITVGSGITVPANCTLLFQSGGELLGTSITINSQIQAAHTQQIFGVGLVVSGLGGEVDAEWFGAVGYSTNSAAAAGVDSTTAIQAAIASINLEAGWAQVQSLSYRACGLTFTRSQVGLHGIAQTYLGGFESTIVCTSPTSTTISFGNGASGALIRGNSIKDLVIIRSVHPTGTATGLSVDNVLGINVSNVNLGDNIRNVYIHMSPSATSLGFANIDVGWGAYLVSSSAYSSDTLTGFYIDSADGNAQNSLLLDHTEAACNAVGAVSTGYLITGSAINDVVFDTPQTSNCSYGISISDTSTAPPTASDLHFTNSILDGCTASCITITSVPLSAGPQVTFNGGYAASSGDFAVDIESSAGVNIFGMQLAQLTNGKHVVYANNSTSLNISGNQIGSVGAIDIGCNTTTSSVFSGNTFQNVTAASATLFAIQASGSCVGNNFSNNVIATDGSAAFTVGYSFDGTSLANEFIGNICNGNVTTCISGVPTGVTPSFTPTAAPGTNNTTVASTAFVTATVAGGGSFTPPTGTGFSHNTSGVPDPAARAVDVSTADITGNMAVSHLNSGTSASSSTFWRGDATWATPPGFTNPMTTLGDLIYGGASGTATRLAGFTVSGTYNLCETATGSAVAPTWCNSPITKAAVTSNFLTAYNATTGVFTAAQAAFTDISGTVAAAQLPLATTGAFGAVKCDGTTITCTAGVIASVGGSTTLASVAAGTAPTSSGAYNFANNNVTTTGEGDFSRVVVTSTVNSVTTNISGGVDIANTLAATSTVGQSSPIFSLDGEYWGGSSSLADVWRIQSVVGNGTNPVSTLFLNHSSGTTGVVSVRVPSIRSDDITSSTSPICPNGVSGAFTTSGCTSGGAATNLAGGVLGSIPYQSAASTTLFVSPNTTAARQFFSETGTGSVGAAPTLGLIGASDISPNEFIAAAGSVNVLTATFSPVVTSLATGLDISILPNLANTTTTPTLNVNGLGAKTITKYGGAVLAAGDLSTTAIASLVYDGTNWELQNPQTLNMALPITTTGIISNNIGGSGLSSCTGAPLQIQNSNRITCIYIDSASLSNIKSNGATPIMFPDGIATPRNGAASTPAAAIIGTWFTGGTSTTTKPQLLIEPTGTTSTNWSTSGTGLGVNAGSGFTGNILDLQMAGASRFSVTAAGLATAVQLTQSQGENVITFSATPTFNVGFLSNIITLTSNITSSTLAAGFAGQSMTLTFCQNGTGGFTAVLPTNWRGAFTIGTTASKCNSQTAVYSVNQTAWLSTSTGVINQ